MAEHSSGWMMDKGWAYCRRRTVRPPDLYVLSLERNRQCAIGLCGYCQFGPTFVSKDGPVLPCVVIVVIW